MFSYTLWFWIKKKTGHKLSENEQTEIIEDEEQKNGNFFSQPILTRPTIQKNKDRMDNKIEK